jgi:hypothetical protein
LGDGLRRGLLSDRTYEKLSENIDHCLEALDMIEANIQQGWTDVTALKAVI